jgi:hypothetical protein
MAEIEQSLEELGDPLFNDPNKPLIIAQMVAKENNIAPKKPGTRTPASASKPAAPAPRTAPKSMLPTGSSRAAPAPAVQPVVDRIAKVGSVHELQTLMRTLGKRDF